MSIDTQVNDHLLLLCGKSATGKSTSLRNLPMENTMFLNTENGKKRPFKGTAKWDKVITDPLQLFEAFDYAESQPDCKYIVIDSLTFLLEMYVSMYVNGAKDGREAWGNFQQYFKRLMQEKVAKSSKFVIFTAHTADKLNETEMVIETAVPVPGALKNNGIEAYFSTVIYTKKMKLSDLKVENDLLVITEKDKARGFKYVFQTDVTAGTLAERIRGPMGMWEDDEIFIDNDVMHVAKRFHEYYGA
ncbi:MAG: hypothetical protein DI616_16055 [Paracoccus denitrificans]|uniref:ATP-binding protein n=1 Tax=Paracoccus denitrificans TaxID=266 RepID=A0A533I6A3_PARDE|nr:MAG: hypothetical protein DI616_16055 [Paracoccus denitrificans]